LRPTDHIGLNPQMDLLLNAVEILQFGPCLVAMKPISRGRSILVSMAMSAEIFGWKKMVAMVHLVTRT
jgi:hypothetical protein